MSFSAPPTRRSTAPWPPRARDMSRWRASHPNGWHNDGEARAHRAPGVDMDPDTLRGQLTVLHEELRAARQVDPRSGALLAEILKDIQRLLEAGGSEARTAGVPLADRLEKAPAPVEGDPPGPAAAA